MNFPSVSVCFRGGGGVSLLGHFLLALLCFSVFVIYSPRVVANSDAGQLLGVTWNDGGPYKIDPNTGVAVQLGTPTGQLFNSMARNSSNVFLASTNSNQLFTIDPQTGSDEFELTVVGFGFGESIRAMAFSDDDRLFAVVSGNVISIDRFFEIDLSTGSASLIGATGLPGLQSLAIAADGNMYSFDIGFDGLGLVTIDPNTGIASDVNPLYDNQKSNMQSLAFSNNGTLYGMGIDALYTVNTSNGELTELASFSLDVRGMEFLPIPEPNSIFLIAILAASLTVFRMKHLPPSH